MSTILIDVGDGTLISPPPAVTQPAPTAPPPPVAPTAPAPSVAPSAIIPQPGTTYVDVGDGTIIPAPAVVAPTTQVATSTQPVITVEDTSTIPQPGKVYIPGEPSRPEQVAPTVTASPQESSAQVDSGATATDSGFPVLPDSNELGHDGQSGGEITPLVDDLDGFQFLAYNVLTGMDFVNHVRNRCAALNLDAIAVFAEAWHEGLNGLIGDFGTSYGPWQMHKNGRLPSSYNKYPNYSAQVQTWAWTANGIDYALGGMANTSARGKTGDAAVHDLTFFYESPADTQQQYILRDSTYHAFLAAGAGLWSQLAAHARGPQTTATAAPSVPVAKPAAQPGLMAGWRDLLIALGRDVPAAGIKMSSTVKAMRKAIA